MSRTRRYRSVSPIHRSFVVAVGILLVASAASAGPQLWLYPADAGPREGGHVVPPGEFTLVIENRGRDPEADAAHAVELVVAVDDPAAITALELVFDDGDPMVLGPEGWEAGTPVLPCSEKPMPRHGEYPAPFLAIALVDLTGFGDLEAGEMVEIDVTVEGDEGLHVHFDAMATGYKKNERCFDVVNPSGHDVTVANRRGGSGSDGCGHVTITKTADPRSIDLGIEVSFLIEVLNDGTCDLTELVLVDLIPEVQDAQGSYPAFQWTGDTLPVPSEVNPYSLKWQLDQLPVDESAVVQLEVVFDQPAADQQKIVNRACVSAAEMRKPRCAAAVVTVGNPFGDDGPAGPGFWCHAVRWILEERSKLPVDAEELFVWLGDVDAGSVVFSELERYRIFLESDSEASFAAAAELLCSPQSAEGAADRLARHLLVLWLNVVSDRLDEEEILDDLCMGDEIMPDGDHLTMTVDQFLHLVDEGFEGADDEQLTFWAEVVDAINNSIVGGEGECPEWRKLSRRQHAGEGWPQLKSKLLNSRD